MNGEKSPISPKNSPKKNISSIWTITWKIQRLVKPSLLHWEEKVLLLCPGNSLVTQKYHIEQYISEESPHVISVNFITDKFSSDYAFISNANRYSQMLGIVTDLNVVPPVLLTSNIVQSDVLNPIGVFNYKTLYEQTGGDNSSVLLLSLLKGLGVTKVAIAGMDGFDTGSNQSNYFEVDMALGLSNNANEALIEQLNLVLTDDFEITWITPSPLTTQVPFGVEDH